MKPYKAAILGGSGFAGAELVRRLLQHPAVELVRVCAADHVGEPLSSAHPHLEGRTDLVFENPAPQHAVAGVDIVLMALPHQASIEVVQTVMATEVRILDLSGAFRLTSPAQYARYYGQPHPRPDLLGQFIYGLPEHNRERIRGARFVSSPGCFATAIELGLLPLARAGALSGRIQTVAITGSSGSGITPSSTTHHPTRANNLRTYRPLNHPQTPEIEQLLSDAGAHDPRLSFLPVSAPIVRGIFASSFVELKEPRSRSDLLRFYTATYAEAPFVRIPGARLPEVGAVTDSNFAEVGLAVEAHESVRTLTAVSALDNLIKGGAGQAIQNMNLMLDLDETLTLMDPGAYP